MPFNNRRRNTKDATSSYKMELEQRGGGAFVAQILHSKSRVAKSGV